METVGIDGYSYKGLLYDAKQGVVASQLLIYSSFCSMIRRGEVPPMDMLNFIAKEINLVLEGKQEPKKMFNKKGTKFSTTSTHYNELVEMERERLKIENRGLRGGMDIKIAFENVANFLCNLGEKISAGSVEKLYNQEKKRMERIKKVTKILSDHEGIISVPGYMLDVEKANRLAEIDKELKYIYKDISQLV